MSRTNKDILAQEAIEMFKKLEKHIGERVSYKGWWYGSYQNDCDILEKVNYFSNVVIGSMGIPFVGYGAAISAIILAETGEVLYENFNIASNYDVREQRAIELEQAKIFGIDIASKRRERRLKKEKMWKEEEEHAAQEAKKKKYLFMKEGLVLVKPETVEEWLQFVDVNSNDGYSVFVVKAVVSMMKKFESGISFEEAEQQVYSEELGLSGYMAGCAANALSHFAKNGEEYRKYWNKKHGVSEEEKGVVNPAILTLSDKKTR